MEIVIIGAFVVFSIAIVLLCAYVTHSINSWLEKRITKLENKVFLSEDELYNLFKERDIKFHLLLQNLELEYVPEKESREPAKIVKKPVGSGLHHFSDWIRDMGAPRVTSSTPAKKRVRPKKK